MKKILLMGKIVQEDSHSMLVMFEGSPAWVWVSKKAISKQSRTRRKKPAGVL
jgi:hypothetical protein